MNPVGASSVVFVALTGAMWSTWLIASNSDEGQQVLARAYMNYATEEAGIEENLFDSTALRALVCGVGSDMIGGGEKPCLAVAAAGRLFIVDAGAGAALALEGKRVGLQRLESVLLTGSDPVRTADLVELGAHARDAGVERALPVYGPVESHEVVRSLNAALQAQGLTGGLQPWAPPPEPGRPVIVFEADGLIVSAFTTESDAFTGRVGYRFDYKGRSLVVAGDGRAEWAEVAPHADVVLHGAQTELLAQLHRPGGDAASPFEVAAAARDAGAGMLVLTGVDPNPMIADIQVRQARRAGLEQVVAGRLGTLVELPLTSQDINVRPL